MAEPSPPPDLVANEAPKAPALSTNPREAYFQLLRIWVQQANVAQNASACFPYYLAANYPQMYAASMGIQLPFQGLGAATGLQLGEANRFGLNNIGNRNPLRPQDMFENPARSTESKKSRIVYGLSILLLLVSTQLYFML